MRRFTNTYAADGKAVRQRAREEAGHRCVRCGHPYECGIARPDRGEWSDCDEQCDHKGIVRMLNTVSAPPVWGEPFEISPFSVPAGKSVRLGCRFQARWRILTVHHFDGDKANDAWWNLLSLCQVCHLSFQSRVDPEIPWMFEHSAWLRPYVAGFYAAKYEGKNLTREEVESRIDELLAYEFRQGPMKTTNQKVNTMHKPEDDNAGTVPPPETKPPGEGEKKEEQQTGSEK